jgi:MoaA/NifB/PqqE/SkfB family radical SAM enzyme
MSEPPNSTHRRLPLMGEPARGEADHQTKGLLRLTMACNERCPFCNVPVESYARPTPPEEEVTRELEAFLRTGESTLTISGGEPTLYRDRLLSVVRRAREAGVPFIELQTNAVLLDADYAGELARAGLTSAFVSLLSHQAPLHDELAGLGGAFERCLGGIDALLGAGVAVTLNPVIAAQTQRTVADYVDFVAKRLPGVQAISLSAVQPHGRAAKAVELLPDYSVLRGEVRRARERAEAHGIKLLNPYCGLPLCIGWDDAADASVEANEALEARARGQSRKAFGLDNRGNKRHGEPCLRCALRTRCGGAWHAYWDHRDGAGLEAPLPRREPWEANAADATGQSIVATRGELSPRIVAALDASTTPSTWLVAKHLRPGDADRLLGSGCSDLAILTDAETLLGDGDTLRELMQLRSANALREPQSRLRVVVGLERLGSFQSAHRAIAALAGTGVEAVRLLLRADARLPRFAEAVQRETGVETTVPRS